MYQGNLNSGSALPLPGMGKQARPVHWRLAWLVASLLTGLGAGASVAAVSPGWTEWAGTEPVNISNSEWDMAWQPVIATGSSGWTVVAWSDHGTTGAERDIYVVFSEDNGRTWPAPPWVISSTVHYSTLPDALVTEGRPYVAWVDLMGEGGKPAALYEAEIGAEGTTAVHSIPSPLSLDEASTQPRLAASADRLHVVFNAGDPSHILYATRPLTVTAWPTATVIYTSTAAGGSWFPTLAINAIDPDGETLHVTWLDVGVGERAIRYMRWSTSTGSTDVYTLSQDAPVDTAWGRPSIALDSSGNPHVVWEEEVGTGSPETRERYVHYARYDTDSGWTTPGRIYDEPVRVNADDPRNIVPSLALMEEDGQVTVCVAWHGFRAGELEPVGAEEILLSCSQDGGQSWPLSPQNVSRSPEAEAVSIVPSIAFDASGRLHSVWQERSQVSHYEIYYAYSLDNKIFLPLVVRSG
jgi:hypothetical protein